MKIKDLSFCTEITKEDTTNVNGGYINYGRIADANARWLNYGGDSLEILGLDGSYLYDSGDAYYGLGPLAIEPTSFGPFS